ncbi:Mkk2p [Rhizophagus irregularis DAOM 197198w]|uniref:Mkk2p n=4 Tax=Rhizophagus irregularis TaxID=588596 RepID=A0A015JSE0_RHIIW|nr:Mkk2p [Rhizophagus irregularis DAOM 197198w]
MSSQDKAVICECCGNPYTVHGYKWCKPCQINKLKQNFTNWSSGNEKIDELIQEFQLKINRHDDIIVEWIPYNQFNDIKEIDKDDTATLYSATWMNGQLKYENYKVEKKRVPNEKVALKCMYNSQNITNEFLSEVKSFSIYRFDYDILKIYGISQNPETRDYIIVFQERYCETCGKICKDLRRCWCKPCKINNLKQNFTNWTSGNEIIDEFIQEMQMKIKNFTDIIVEWIPYNRFNDIKEISKDDTATLYSAIWIDGPLKYLDVKINEWKYERLPNKRVALRCVYNSQKFIDEAKGYSIDDHEYDIPHIYGITQNANTKDYIIVLDDRYCKNCGKIGEIYTNEKIQWCKPCQINNLNQNLTSGNEKIDNFIQEMQLKIEKYHSKIVEWIPYNQFSNIKIITKDDFTTLYSAIWIDGPLYFGMCSCIRVMPNKKVVLKCLSYNSQNITDEFLSEARLCFDNNTNNDLFKYGISQNPNTNDYIIVFGDDYCEICGKVYTDTTRKYCESCLINDLKKKFANWTSGNDKIDEFIQEMQMKMNGYDDILVEWIPYNQFDNIKEVGKGGFAMVYSAIWKDGPFIYHYGKSVNENYKRSPNRVVALKNLYNSQNISNEFLNEIKKYSIKFNDNILKIYGISQNPDTKDYIMVFEYANGGNFINYINNYAVNWSWHERLEALENVINGLKIIHENDMVHRDFHTGNILSFINVQGGDENLDSSFYISDMGLCGDVSNVDETKLYGVMPFMSPEVLRGNPYTKAADIYSFGMIMYFVATGMQPFFNCAHDEFLVLNICDGIRPEINEQKAPKCYIELMKRCWDSDPNNRPSAIKIEELINSFMYPENKEIIVQFKEAEEYRKANFLSIKNNQLTTHSQAYYTSRLLNQFTRVLTECLDCLDCSIDD